MHSRRDFLRSAVAGVALGVSGNAEAQIFPSRPVTMIVPYAAGGPSDTIGRIIAEGLRSSLGQPVIIENVGGASGSVGTGRAARAAPDGYTICLGLWSTHVVNGAILSLPYDLVNDFDPIGLIAKTPLLIVARKSLPSDNLKSFLDWLKANPDTATAGTGGIGGGASRVAGLLLQRRIETTFQFAHYRGLGPAMQDLIAGHIDFLIDYPANSLPQARTGTIKAFAVTAPTRLATAADIPTVDEAGLPGFHMSTWHALFAPKGLPKEVVAILNRAMVDTLTHPTIRERLTALGQEIYPRKEQTPEVLATLQRSEIEKWWPILRPAGINSD